MKTLIHTLGNRSSYIHLSPKTTYQCCTHSISTSFQRIHPQLTILTRTKELMHDGLPAQSKTSKMQTLINLNTKVDILQSVSHSYVGNGTLHAFPDTLASQPQKTNNYNTLSAHPPITPIPHLSRRLIQKLTPYQNNQISKKPKNPVAHKTHTKARNYTHTSSQAEVPMYYLQRWQSPQPNPGKHKSPPHKLKAPFINPSQDYIYKAPRQPTLKFFQSVINRKIPAAANLDSTTIEASYHPPRAPPNTRPHMNKRYTANAPTKRHPKLTKKVTSH
eukprot:gene13110-8956_t